MLTNHVNWFQRDQISFQINVLLIRILLHINTNYVNVIHNYFHLTINKCAFPLLVLSILLICHTYTTLYMLTNHVIKFNVSKLVAK